MNRLSALRPYFARYPRKLVLGLLSILLSVSVGLAAPIVIGGAVDAFAAQVSTALLLRYGLLLVAITAFQGLFNFAQRMLLVTLSRDIEYDLRNDYFAHLESLPRTFFHGWHTGDLMARATNDLQAVRMLCGPAIMYGANTVFAGCGALFFMLRIDARLTVLALCAMPLVAVATQVFGQRIHHHFDRVQEQFSALSTRVQENLAGLRVVRAYAREESEMRRFEALNTEYVERNRRLIRWTSAFHPLLQLLVGVGFVAVLWYGGTQVWRGAITVGQFVSFNFFLTKLVWPMIAIGWVINLVQRGSASLGRINDVLEVEPEIRDVPPLFDDAVIRGRIEIRGLTLTYPGEKTPVLSDIELEVEVGRVVAFVGRTGAGKSTLLSLLPRLVDPPEGALFVDGIDSHRLPLARLRGAMAVVPQETFLFSASVRDNIALGRPHANEEEIREMARLAGLGSDLETFPKGLETMVGERGITLSGGQKQRVALARALLRDPRILLLDDCLSAVDAETEEEILENLRTVFAGRTVLQVSHRISAVQAADRIFVLERGRIVDRGRHHELVQRPGLYADLHRRQQLEEELATA
ncbi:MAG: ABC transporter ATP-binding protein/permease [Acidobacteriota bacterium]|nr:ABC transporter ATP-binding protein/permease [Acidobacteriota bacterium]